MSFHHSHPPILSLLKASQSQYTLLDRGCCFAQDVRKLVDDGARPQNLYACDLKGEFLDVGYDLFKDKETINNKDA